MHIKRGFAYIGGVRKFRMYVDEEEVAALKLSSSVDLDIEGQHQIIQFRTMKLEKSKRYYLPPNVAKLHVNVNPMFRVMYASLFVIFMILMFIRAFVGYEQMALLTVLILILSVSVLVIHYTNLKSYIQVLAYDDNNQLIPLTECEYDR